MRKPAFCICKNKGADQLHGNRPADQHVCTRYIDSILTLPPKSEISILQSFSVVAQPAFLSDLVENPNNTFFMMRLIWFVRYEPPCEKTDLRGFRPGPTQTGLYSHRSWLEA